MFSINIISLKCCIPFFAYLLNTGTYLIAIREKSQILKNGSDYQGAWPPLVYIMKPVILFMFFFQRKEAIHAMCEDMSTVKFCMIIMEMWRNIERQANIV